MNQDVCVCVSLMLHTLNAVRPIYLVLFREPEYLSDSYYFPSPFSLSLSLRSSLYLSTFRSLTLSVCLFSLHFYKHTHRAQGQFPGHSRPMLMTHGKICVCLRACMYIYMCVHLCVIFTMPWCFSIVAATFAVVKNPSTSHGRNRDFFNFSSVLVTARFHSK